MIMTFFARSLERATVRFFKDYVYGSTFRCLFSLPSTQNFEKKLFFYTFASIKKVRNYFSGLGSFPRPATGCEKYFPILQ